MASYTRFLGLRYAFSRQRSRFTALVSLASMLGMALGVASLITVLSVMNGFGGELRGRILALVPHAYVELDPEVDDTERVEAALGAVPEVLATAPYTRETVLFSGSYRHQGAVLFGVDSALQPQVTDLDEYLLVGSLDALASPFSVILGSSLARALGVVPGDQLRVVLPQITTSPLGVFPRSRMLTVVGLFEVGAQQDSSLAYTSMETANRLFRKRGQQGLQLRTDDLMTAPNLSPLMSPLLAGVGSYRPWSETQGSLFRAIKMEKLTVSILLLSVVLVAAFNVVSTLVMAVTEKRRDIAVLRTMGATPGEISVIFLTQGLSLALFGVLVGAALGIVLALNIASVVDFFERLVGTRIFDPQVYFISRLPSKLMLSDVAMVVSAATALSVCAVAYPAWRASRIAPAEVLRYE
ncbi:MAG: lipoprotein-releasing ABC transporter permease subunit [Congregibacter sp.]